MMNNISIISTKEIVGPLDFFIVGLPLTPDSITEEFIKFFEDDTPTLLISAVNLLDLTNNDYETSKVGYDYIFNTGYKLFPPENRPTAISKHILHVPLWIGKNGRRLPKEVTANILNLYTLSRKEWKSVRIAILVPGSPYFYDLVSSKLMEYIPASNVIDTKSSAQLAGELISQIEGGKYSNSEMVIHQNFNNIQLEKNAINIVGCVGAIYNHSPIAFLLQINQQDEIFLVNLGHTNSIKKYPVDEIIFTLNTNRNQLNSTTLIIIPSDYANKINN